MTTSLTIYEIPNYLMDSELYQNINSYESFDVPDKFFRKELEINTFDDLVSYILIFNFWIVNKFPIEIYQWVFKNQDKINMDLLNGQFLINSLVNEIKIIIDTPNDKLCGKFSSIGNLSLLKFVHENGCVWNCRTCILSAENGHLECLKYVHENGCDWNWMTCYKAAENGHLECLKFVHENGCKWNSFTCSYAALNGHLECLKYAHENGCEWNKETCSSAAENGHLECLKYAHENGCEWLGGYTCIIAAANGHLECLKYAQENGCESNY